MGHLNKGKRKTKKAYSLLEIVVSLVIVAFIITSMFGFIIASMRVSSTALARSLIREELSDVSLLISRDLRNSDYITGCTTTSCTFVVDAETIKWYICDSTKICEDKNGTTIFKSSGNLKINFFDFTVGFSDASNISKLTVILTISAEHTNPNLNVLNVVRQTSISTRNYELK